MSSLSKRVILACSPLVLFGLAGCSDILHAKPQTTIYERREFPKIDRAPRANLSAEDEPSTAGSPEYADQDDATLKRVIRIMNNKPPIKVVVSCTQAKVGDGPSLDECRRMDEAANRAEEWRLVTEYCTDPRRLKLEADWEMCRLHMLNLRSTATTYLGTNQGRSFTRVGRGPRPGSYEAYRAHVNDGWE